MNDCAAAHRRWGYKSAWARATSKGIVVGRDTFRRLWRAEGAARASAQSPQAPRRAYSAWSGLVLLGRCGTLMSSSTRTGRGRVFKVCHAIDEFTRQHLAVRVERRMGAADVIDMRDLAVLTHGAPQVLRADNGPT